MTRVSLKKLIKRNPEIRRALEQSFPDGAHRPRTNKKEFNQFRDEIARTFARLGYNPQNELDNCTLKDSFQLKPESRRFLKSLACYHTWTESIECDKLSTIDSVQDRQCTTLFHMGAIEHDKLNNPSIFNSTNLAGTTYFNAKDVARFVLDFEPEDYADLKRQLGARLIFHSNSYVASATDLDFFVTRGYKYDFSIERGETAFPSDFQLCEKYKNNLPSYSDSIDPRVPLGRDACLQNCIVRNVIRHSNCWPSTMPYFHNDSLDPKMSLKSCGSFREPQYFSIYKELLRIERLKISLTTGAFQDNVTKINSTSPSFAEERAAYMKIRRHCWSRCPISCRFSRYTISVTKSVWPSDVRLLFDETGKERLLRHCCAIISIKFSHFHHVVNEFVWKRYIVDTIGNIGGLLAVWLGLSMVSVYNAIQKLIQVCNQNSLSRIKIQATIRKIHSNTASILSLPKIT